MRSTHHWSDNEISETIDIALNTAPGSDQRRTAAIELAERVTAATPANPLRPTAAATAVLAACYAIDENYRLANKELVRQIEQRRADGTLVRRSAGRSGEGRRDGRPALTVEDLRVDRLIDVCLALPPGDNERWSAAEAVAPGLSRVALAMIDEAIDQRYPQREKLPGLKRLIELRRSEGRLARQYPWPPETQ